MSKPRLNLYLTDSTLSTWEHTARAELREVKDWARVVLDLVAESGLTVVELKEVLAKATAKKPKE